MRSLIERAATISYLETYPGTISLWKSGWRYRERPSLATMLDAMHGSGSGMTSVTSKGVVEVFNHITHGDPIGSGWNTVRLDDGALGYAVGKVLSDGPLCDLLCVQACCYLIVLLSRARVIFSPHLNT
jgi:hypothetical protein